MDVFGPKRCLSRCETRRGQDQNINFSLWFPATHISLPGIESVNWTISVTINGFYFLAQKTKQEIQKNQNLCPFSSFLCLTKQFYGFAHLPFVSIVSLARILFSYPRVFAGHVSLALNRKDLVCLCNLLQLFPAIVCSARRSWKIC